MIQWVLKKGRLGEKDENRTKISLLAGLVGLVSNGLLTIVKLSIGLFSGSVSVLADAMNNLMDSTSSIITIAGAHFADKPPDEDHPQGHGRVEYVTGLIISCFVIVVGLQFSKTSIERIINPEKTHFTLLAFILLVLSIGVKFWQAHFNKKVGEAIDSTPLKATAADSLGDCLVTGVVLASMLLDTLTDLAIDGLVGLVVSILIIKSGWELISETMSILIGQGPSRGTYQELKQRMMTYDHVQGVHDIIFNSFGPEKTIVVLDAEFPSTMSLLEVHKIVDRAEREISAAMDIHLIIHVDPVGETSPFEREIMALVDGFIQEKEGVDSYHDLTLVADEKAIYLDLTVLGSHYPDQESRDRVREDLVQELEEKYPGYKALVNIDLKY
ncbi:hypothetical protein HMPREF1633_07350 [Tissierellia bacterium S5-A11]|nr:hypothetical protein HMPREF1633_07350 [Tissierellia bacterium S5-A11]